MKMLKQKMKRTNNNHCYLLIYEYAYAHSRKRKIDGDLYQMDLSFYKHLVFTPVHIPCDLQ